MLFEYEIKISEKPIEYSKALLEMEEHHNEVLNGKKHELFWLLEHEDVYTAGISAKENEHLKINNIPILHTKRGGKFTYHGKGQLICYIICNLKKRTAKLPDIRCFVESLEDTIINTLKTFGIKGEKRKDRIGVWVKHNHTEEKIAAIGIKFSKGITMHGFSLNINPDLSKFTGIIPCGISEFGVCSMKSLGKVIDFTTVRNEIIINLKKIEADNFYQNKCKNI